MPGYLDHYGAGEEKRNRLIVRAVVSGLAIIVITGLGWYLLENHHQEAVVKNFVGDLRRGDYQAAYRDWGCGSGKPCTGLRLSEIPERTGDPRNPHLRRHRPTQGARPIRAFSG